MTEGETIADRYRLERKLADGGMSSVWEAADLADGARLALKLSRPRGVRRDEFEARFRREAVIARYLGQAPRGFVRVHDWGKHGGDALFMVMDLVDDAVELDLLNPPLHVRLERMALVAERVADVHAQGVVHRDLKPSNVLVRRRDGEVFLTDFGLAKVTNAPPDAGLELLEDELTQTGVSMGTLVYMAPEQMIDAKRAGPPADVFSLGVMLYATLTGDLPFKGKTGELVATKEALRDGSRVPPGPSQVLVNVPPELDALCVRCMAGLPDERPAALEVAHTLARVITARTNAPTRRL